MNDAFLADALGYLGHPEQDAVLVLRHAGGVRGKKLLDAVKKGGWPVVDCQPLKKDADKVAFVMAEFKAGGRRIEQDAVQALVNAVGANLSELAAACMGINAVKGVEIGEGFAAGRARGSESMDAKRASGIDGGISTGEAIRLRVAFKPTSSIGGQGRHDPCVGIRAVPIGEAMMAVVLADHFLRHRGQTGREGGVGF